MSHVGLLGAIWNRFVCGFKPHPPNQKKRPLEGAFKNRSFFNAYRNRLLSIIIWMNIGIPGWITSEGD